LVVSPAVQALPDPERDPVRSELFLVACQSAADAKRGMHRSLSMILVGDRSPEEGHDAIAEELVDGAFVPVDLGQDQVEGPGHQPMHLLGIEPLRERREARDVGEEHGDLLALSFQRASGGQDLVREVLGSVALG
jgi:hypothetical protein